MYKFETLEYPKKYPVPGWIKIAVLAILILSYIVTTRVMEKRASQIIITNVQISDFSRAHVEVSYTIENKSRKIHNVWLLFDVFDKNKVVIGNALYQVTVAAGKKQDMIKIIDQLSRALEEGEQPTQASVSIYKKKVF